MINEGAKVIDSVAMTQVISMDPDEEASGGESPMHIEEGGLSPRGAIFKLVPTMSNHQMQKEDD